jgi:hypothetical protein
MEIAPSVQVEWYVAGFPEAMVSRSGRPGLQILEKQWRLLTTMRTLLNPYGRRSSEARRRIRVKERRTTGKIGGDGNIPTRIAIPRVRIRRTATLLHPDQKRNGVRHHHDGHTDPKEQKGRQ